MNQTSRTSGISLMKQREFNDQEVLQIGREVKLGAQKLSQDG